MGFKCPNRKGVADFLQEVSVTVCSLFFELGNNNLPFAMTILILL
jgi:hypothetical protein